MSSYPSIYIKAKSKKAVNKMIEEGADIVGMVYTPWSATITKLRDMPDQAVVKIFEREIDGSPYTKAYGNWDKKKNRIK